MILTVEQAEDLARRTLAAVADASGWSGEDDIDGYCRERVASDLAGLRDHDQTVGVCGYGPNDCPDARRYADGLRRTARLYGVEL